MATFTPEQARIMVASRIALSVIGGYRIDVERMSAELLAEVRAILPSQVCTYMDFVHICECQVCGARWKYPPHLEEGGMDVRCQGCKVMVRRI